MSTSESVMKFYKLCIWGVIRCTAECGNIYLGMSSYIISRNITLIYGVCLLDSQMSWKREKTINNCPAEKEFSGLGFIILTYFSRRVYEHNRGQRRIYVYTYNS